MPPDSWNEWSNHVLKELERLNDCYEKLVESVQDARTEIAMLKVKSGMWGALGGLVPVVVTLVFWSLNK